MFQYEVVTLDNDHAHLVEADWYCVEENFVVFYLRDLDVEDRTVFRVPNANLSYVKRLGTITKVADFSTADNFPDDCSSSNPPSYGAWVVCDICNENQDQPVYSITAPPHDVIGRVCNVYTICEACFEDNFDMTKIN